MNKIFENLFVLDLANNHFGDVSHAKKIIDNFSKVIKKNKIKAAIKFQFRDLDTFVHKSERNNDKNKYVKRFLSTEMSLSQFDEIRRHIKKNGFLTSCTPFDENSVDNIEKMKFDLLKIASVSSNDWSLLERVSENKLSDDHKILVRLFVGLISRSIGKLQYEVSSGGSTIRLLTTICCVKVSLH